eukprot:tig00000139_g8324.t1
MVPLRPDAPQALAASAQQLIAASASGVGVPAGAGRCGSWRAALVLAAALKAGNERLLFAHADAPAALALQLSTATASTPRSSRPHRPPARFSLVPSSACPPRPLVPRGA